MLKALKSKIFYISNKGLLGSMVGSIVWRILGDIGKDQFFKKQQKAPKKTCAINVNVLIDEN